MLLFQMASNIYGKLGQKGLPGDLMFISIPK